MRALFKAALKVLWLSEHNLSQCPQAYDFLPSFLAAPATYGNTWAGDSFWTAAATYAMAVAMPDP